MTEPSWFRSWPLFSYAEYEFTSRILEGLNLRRGSVEPVEGDWFAPVYRSVCWAMGGWSEDYQSGFTPVRGDGGVGLLKGCGVGLAGADAHRMVEAEDEDLTVANLSGFRCGTDRLDDFVHLIGRQAISSLIFGRKLTPYSAPR